ncbi:hypothetical protein PC128_g17645 [Phytophthora cactorum]|nr:hypothetical protein PC128_g17645 [Phytophthora cactorum]
MPHQLNQSNLAPKKKMAILLSLTGKAVNEVLPHGAKASASRVFSCHRDTVTAVWSKKATPESGEGAASTTADATQSSSSRRSAPHDHPALSEGRLPAATVLFGKTSIDGRP